MPVLTGVIEGPILPLCMQLYFPVHILQKEHFQGLLGAHKKLYEDTQLTSSAHKKLYEDTQLTPYSSIWWKCGLACANQDRERKG